MVVRKKKEKIMKIHKRGRAGKEKRDEKRQRRGARRECGGDTSVIITVCPF